MKLTDIKTPMDLELFIKSRDSIMYSDELKDGEMYHVLTYDYNLRHRRFDNIHVTPTKMIVKIAEPDTGIFCGMFGDVYITNFAGDVVLPVGIIPNYFIFKKLSDANNFADVLINLGVDAMMLIERQTNELSNKLTQKMLSAKCKFNMNLKDDFVYSTQSKQYDHLIKMSLSQILPSSDQIQCQDNSVQTKMEELAKQVGDAKELLFGVNRNTPWHDIINKGQESEIQTTLNGMLEAMKKLQSSEDAEYAHSDADRILCQALECLDQHELVEAWKKVEKYYA